MNRTDEKKTTSWWKRERCFQSEKYTLRTVWRQANHTFRYDQKIVESCEKKQTNETQSRQKISGL